VIRPNGKIVLELTPGITNRGDGTEAAELEIVVDEAHSGPYRVDVATNRHAEDFINIASDMVGSAPLDVDQVHTGASYRYVRVKNRSARGNVCLDAVGVHVR
jgi:hypothetical protein